MNQSSYSYRGFSFQFLSFLPDDPLNMPAILYLPDSPGDNGYATLISREFQEKHPCGVLIPEYRDWTDPTAAQALQRWIFDIRRQYKMDICRTYLVGAGFGAVCAWHLIGGYPRLFAAMIAIGGCGDPYRARNAKFVPIWAFHTADDDRISVTGPSTVAGKQHLAGSRRLTAALRTEGSELMRYTEKDTGADTLKDETLSSSEVWDWMFEQDRKNIIWITYIRPGIYRLDDWFMATAYLVEGEKKALLIDTTMTHANMLDTVKRLTHLPVELAITHPHRDHMMHAFEFERVYIHEEDRKAMDDCITGMYSMRAGKVPQRPQTNTYPKYMDQLNRFQEVIGLKDGEIIDLGGIQIEMMYLGGHTPNHVVFADHGHRCLFTGDAVGSGCVVGVRYREGTFHDVYAWYRDNLAQFIERMKGKENYTCFGGHFIQENTVYDEMQEDYLNQQSEVFVPLSWEVIQDMYTLSQELADGLRDSEANMDTGVEFIARYGSAGLAGSRVP